MKYTWGAVMTADDMRQLQERTLRGRKRLGQNTARTPEVLAADRADELAEMTWLVLAAKLKR